MSSCGTGSHVEEGAGNGAVFGTMFGSALGGLLGGPRGSDMGALTGMIGGAMVGAAAGSAVDKKEQAAMERHRRAIAYDDAYGDYGSRRRTRNAADDGPQYGGEQVNGYGDVVADESGFDPTGSGDDRISFDESPTGELPRGTYPGAGETERKMHIGGGATVQPRTVSVEQLKRMAPANGIRLNPLIEIRKASFVDADGDGIISRGEQCRVTFEIMNNSTETLRDIRPAVAETTGNRHIRVSPGLRVESIRPGRGVRYTAVVAADGRLKDGEAVIKVVVAQGDNEVASQLKEFHVKTSKKAMTAR